jgi:signal transduction histidine kinase
MRAGLWTAGFALGLLVEAIAGSGQNLPEKIGDLTTGWVLVACGLVAWSRRRQSNFGPLLTAAGFAWFLGSLAESRIGVLATVGAGAVILHRGPLIHAIVGYPGGRISGGYARAVAACGYVYALIPAISSSSGAATVVIAGLVVTATARGRQRSAGPERQARMSAGVAAMAFALVLVANGFLRAREANPDQQRAGLWVYEVVLVMIAFGLLTGLLRGAWTRAAVTRLVVELGDLGKSGTLRDRLAHALGDSSLQVAYWLPEQNGYVDEGGRPVALPGSEVGSEVTLIDGVDGRIAALVHDPWSIDDPALLEAVASGTRMAISNVRLRTQLRGQVAELIASRRRIIDAADAQRRLLQQELRDGAGSHLATVAELLASVKEHYPEHSDASTPDPMRLAVSELDQAQANMGELAEGIHPRRLTDGGLVAAIGGLANRFPLPVVLSLCPERLAASVESAVYFVIAEALTNVVKHARASAVTIDVARSDDGVSVRISDDGIGGADPSVGTGLRGLADRVEALAGRMWVESAAGSGTSVRADIPETLPSVISGWSAATASPASLSALLP